MPTLLTATRASNPELKGKRPTIGSNGGSVKVRIRFQLEENDTSIIDKK